MFKKICAVGILFFVLSAVSNAAVQTVNVTAQKSGTLVLPTTFFNANSNLIMSGIGANSAVYFSGTNAYIIGTLFVDSATITNGLDISGNTYGSITLYDDDGTHGLTLRSADTMTTNINLTLPSAPYTGFLKFTLSSETNLAANFWVPNETTAYAAGTVYNLTASSALIDFGTTDPSITLATNGTYKISARAYVKYSGATYAGNQTLTIKLRRTNNTAADVSNSSTTVDLEILTTTTKAVGVIVLPDIIYTTSNNDDIIQLWGAVSATPSAGNVVVNEASIVAHRLY